jgi:hypothetical protein
VQWKELEQKVLEALSIEDEYKRLGLRITGKSPSASGWLQCRAMGREDKTPSAAIHVAHGLARGRYRDLGTQGDSLSLWDFAVRYGTFADWREARRHYTQQAGLKKHIPKTEDRVPGEPLDFLAQQPADMHFGLLVKDLVKVYPGITAESLRTCGARVARYPKKSQEPTYVVALPCYGVELFDAAPTGYVFMAVNGLPIMKFNGEGQPKTPVKRMTDGRTGLVGRWGLQHLAQAELVYKVEGISGLLTMQALIPADMRTRHVVITNAGGATEAHLPFEVAPLFADKEVVIMHDADKAGQDGAQLWLSALGPVAKGISNAVLPYKLREKHGLDLRDWINEKEDEPDVDPQ